jgi:hypothetical protein
MSLMSVADEEAARDDSVTPWPYFVSSRGWEGVEK